FVLLMTSLKPTLEQFNRQFQLRELFERFPIDIRIVATLIATYFAFLFNGSFPRSIQTLIYRYTDNRSGFLTDFIVTGVISFALIVAIVFMVVSIWVSLKGQ